MVSFKRLFLAIAVLLAAMGSTSVFAAPLAISDTPIFLGGRADPNVMFTLDDSGSMGWEVMPDGLRSSVATSTPYPSSSRWSRRNVYDDYFDPASADVAQVHSASQNGIYYDPTVRYVPWSNADASLMANASPTCADYDPMNPSATTCVDFKVQYTVCQGNCTNVKVYPAHYFTWDGVGSVTNAASYTHTIIEPATTTYTGGPNRSDCASAPTCTYNEEIQNFANWFQYYRNRMMSAKAGVGRAFAAQGTAYRVGFATINTGSATIDGQASNGALVRGVRPFLGTDRTDWFNLLYGATPSGSTPLRLASKYVGEYFTRTDNSGPWGKAPGANDTSAHSVCRQNFNILMSDGYWNGSTPSVGDVDSSNGAVQTSSKGVTYQYTPVNPYQDGQSDTLADVAMNYWVNDLRTDLTNAVPTSTQDPAFWQHMVTYTVGLGVQGVLDPNADLPALTSGAKSWPTASSNQIDDMWHAAVNGHGLFFSAKNPTEFAAALASQLQNINDLTSSAASVALSSTTLLRTGTEIFGGEMNSGDWSGTLYVQSISDGATGTICPPVPYGEICPAKNWDAATLLTNHLTTNPAYYNSGRKIATYKPSTHAGVAFRWTDLDAAQQTVLRTDPDNGTLDSVAIGQRRLDYLRGKNDTLFRARTNYLGDIIYSAPVFVGPPNSRYPDDWNGAVTEPEDAAGKQYSSFVSSNASRGKMVYVGANDGMLHAFDATTGEEVFAYIPGAVYGTVDVANGKFGRLNQLTSQSYASKHLYFVDGSPKVEDVFYGNNWHTALVGTLRAGGRGVYALDITSASASTDAAAAAKVLWEFTDADDPDLGLTLGDPFITRMQNGRWAVVVGNGYNNSTADGNASTTGHAVAFALFFDANLSDGSWDLGTDYLKFDSKVGTTATPNGMASPAVADVDFDMLADFVYVGDLQGNMWKIDVSSPNVSNWGTAFGTAAVPVPLFVAKDGAGVPQPITTRPEVGAHPFYGSYMVYFGTGKAIEPIDNLTTGQQTQTFYGVWDKNGQWGGFSVFNRGDLLQQQIIGEVTVDTNPDPAIINLIGFRIISNNTIAWHDSSGTPSGTPPTTHMGWYMDLLNVQGGNTANGGEKQVTDPVLRDGKIIFTTMIPPLDPCDFGGSGWLMDLNAIDGAPLPDPVFDVYDDGTGQFNAKDLISIDLNGDGVPEKYAPSGRGFDNIPSKPVVAKGDDGIERKYVSDASGDTVVLKEKPGAAVDSRITWQQLR